jgi:RNA polymerase sigma-70 factor, ECF subfamily
MKVLAPKRPDGGVSSEAAALPRQPVRSEARPSGAAARPDFAEIYDAWFDDVSRWLLALGAPAADNEDLAQEVFLVVRRRLGDFDHRNVAGWLYRIASRQVGAYKRRRWFKSVFSRQQPDAWQELASDDGGPAVALEEKERRRVLDDLVARMNEKRRATFVLFELEGYSGEEIARIQRIPVATVWTRLHHARKEFFTLVEGYRHRQREGGP